ncbi:MAG TPA: GNAT family N-acetyltransferase, partial [Terriglobales bacterium]|nr:GNAT family N-acetyltransferase [Terriglobales bacterium]
PAGFQRHRALDVETLSAGMNALINLHTERWAEAGHSGAFASRRFRDFHLEYSQNALASGQLDLTWITIEGKPVVAQYNIIDGDQVSFYQCGRRIGLPNHVRLGTVMHMFSLQDAIARGSRVYDFLGGEEQYKSILASGSRPLTRVRIGRPGTLELVFQGLKSVKRLGASLTERGLNRRVLRRDSSRRRCRSPSSE